jgi:hypothetical protein
MVGNHPSFAMHRPAIGAAPVPSVGLATTAGSGVLAICRQRRTGRDVVRSDKESIKERRF